MDSVDDEKPITKYIIVTGGNMSGLGKGTAMSSMAVLLLTKNILLTTIKIDPYLNIDAGTMSPYEHGEVYVLEDGGEVDLDLGNYERFLNIRLTYKNNITSGKIYEEVIKKERKGEYLGKTVQVVPHVTDAIQKWIKDVIDENIKKMKKEYNIDSFNKIPCMCLIEVGGTVGDIESAVYLEALQQLINNLNNDDVCLCHLSYVPIIGNLREQKTKPTQHSVKILREAGLKPDFIFCRCEEPLTQEAIKKIALFSQVKNEHVISLHDTSNVYKVPLILEKQNVCMNVLKKLNLENIVLNNKLQISPYSFNIWKQLADRYESPSEQVVIGIVGKYTASNDTYLSIISSLVHACLECGFKLVIKYINSSHLSLKQKKQKKNMDWKKKAKKYSYENFYENSSTEKLIFVDDTTSDEDYDKKRRIKYEKAWETLKSVDGVLVPGGFGTRGIEGKYLSSKYCRLHNIPYLGICLGMQIAVIDVAREYLNVNANSEEFEDTTEMQYTSPQYNAVPTDNVNNNDNNNNQCGKKNKNTTNYSYNEKEKKENIINLENFKNEMNEYKKDAHINENCSRNTTSSCISNKSNSSHKPKVLASYTERPKHDNVNTLKKEIHFDDNISTSILNDDVKVENNNYSHYQDTYIKDKNTYDDTDPMFDGKEYLKSQSLILKEKCIKDIPKKLTEESIKEKIKLIGIESYYKSIEEIDNNNVIISMSEFKGDDNKGGTMRLGVKQSKIIDKESLTYKAYDEELYIYERHRHRYEINPKYVPLLEAVGLSFVAKDIHSVRMEICEIKNLDFYVGVQFHPEFTSRPFKSNPIFLAFVLASKKKLKERLNKYGNKLCSGILYK
ncbi:cytidine triphosphate synthetase [Plasmodium gaboni]|uniref:CTP synthase n=1 Tax=Plasmodium gaboni TaxID=647221 RepID=A0ABY1UTF3_9APIC|nr:cytidine triphosphate synthetase [Plasmodium gaboni]